MRTKGFTFIELMVVLSLLGLLFSMIWPAYPSLLQSYRLDAAADGIKDIVAFARASAVLENRRYRLEFQNRPFSYVLYKEERSGGRSDFISYGGRGFARRPVWEDLTLRGIQTLDFYPNGTCQSSEFELLGKDGKKIILRLDGFHAKLRKLEKTI